MKENDRLKVDEEKSDDLTISKPEDQIYQKLHLCDYLRELYETAGEENEHSEDEKKNPPVGS